VRGGPIRAAMQLNQIQHGLTQQCRAREPVRSASK
jgi:hypothetical protein